MDISNRILSDITVYMKYAKYMPELKRRETWQELVTRNMEMHIKMYPKLEKEIRENYQYVYKKQVLPSMRSMQFAGKPIEISPNRIYNCAFAPIDDWRVFSEIMFLLLGGTGVGYSVQKHHVDVLPEIRKPNKERGRRWLVADSIEGWADAVKVLVKSYFFGGSHIQFDFSDIRPKGARLVTSGGKAPGPQPLKECLIKLEGILDSKEDGEKLSPIEVHDIGRANNSAVLMRHKITKEYFMELWKRIEASGAGEPGIYLSNDKDWGTNPCCEIALRPFQFCNLTEVNVSNVVSQEDYEDRVRAASFIGTLQAGYTDFHYLRPIWQRTTEKDALVGISMTGIGSGAVLGLNMKSASKVVKEENERVANLIGINKAARTTTVKPAGTTSLTLGTSSGIHAWHNDYYIRRVRVGKNESIYTHLKENHPELVEDEYFRPHDTAVISIPQKAPEGSILRNESPIQLLERVKKVQQEWIRPGHRSGSNAHNVSATISIREHEWPAVGEWMWENKEHYNGLSCLPYNGGTYVQAPFEDCTKEKYEELMLTLKDVDLSKIVENNDETDLSGELACAGGACEITLV